MYGFRDNYAANERRHQDLLRDSQYKHHSLQFEGEKTIVLKIFESVLQGFGNILMAIGCQLQIWGGILVGEPLMDPPC